MGFMPGKQIRISFHNTLLLLLLVTSLVGCNYRSRSVLYRLPNEIENKGIPLVHLNKDTTENFRNYEHLIRPDDRIGVRFLNNSDISSGVTMTGNAGSNQDIAFRVDRKGYVKLPMVGKVNLEGLTKDSAATTLEERYKVNFKNPNIEVSILGLSVTVEGEVKTPGVYELNREKTSLVEVIAAAGGMTAYAKKDRVKILRKKDDGKNYEVLIFDMTLVNTLEREELVLRDKDIIYVEPRNIRVVGEAIAPYTTFITLISTVATLSVVIFNVVRTSRN